MLRNGAMLSVVSWNIALLQPSFYAPARWSAAHSAAFLSKQIQRIKPDVVALQEAPDADFDLTSFMPSDAPYTKIQVNVETHCGFVQAYVDTAEFEVLDVTTIARHSIVVRLLSKTEPPKRVAFSTGHLAPGPCAALTRKGQLGGILFEDAPLFWIGDANMREREGVCTDFDDAHTILRTSENRYTWDSITNHFHGDDSFRFRCRFDRCFFRHHSLQCTRFELLRGQVSGKHFLSDHFGMHVVFRCA
jgi:endonuclease/exonuclease/phosphatase family metal-dependent hydrolase